MAEDEREIGYAVWVLWPKKDFAYLGYICTQGRPATDEQRHLDYFREIQNLLARRHPLMSPPGLTAVWNNQVGPTVIHSLQCCLKFDLVCRML